MTQEESTLAMLEYQLSDAETQISHLLSRLAKKCPSTTNARSARGTHSHTTDDPCVEVVAKQESYSLLLESVADQSECKKLPMST